MSRRALEHLVQYKVESVEGQGDKGYFAIVFEGGDYIGSTARLKKPVGLEDMVLMSVDENDTGVQLNFGSKPGEATAQVALSKGHYTINGLDPWNDDEEELPPDPSDERIQDQPEGGFADPLTEEEMARAEAQSRGESADEEG